MRFRLWLALCVVVALGARPAAQPPVTVESIVEKNIAAKGGSDLLTATQTVRMSGRVTTPGGQLQMSVWAKRPDRKRTEAEHDGQKLIEAFDGTNGWLKRGGLPAQSVPPGPALENAKRQAEFDTGLLNYKERGRRIELASPLPIQGAWHLRVTPEQGPVSHYYIDATTGLERRTVMSVPGRGGQSSTLEMRFSDFRKVEGRTVPFVVEMVVDGKPMSKTELDKIEFNVPIDDAFFRMPGR